VSGVRVLQKAFSVVQDDEANIFKKVDDDDKGNQLDSRHSSEKRERSCIKVATDSIANSNNTLSMPLQRYTVSVL
jgi:hypothetical protein